MTTILIVLTGGTIGSKTKKNIINVIKNNYSEIHIKNYLSKIFLKKCLFKICLHIYALYGKKNIICFKTINP